MCKEVFSREKSDEASGKCAQDPAGPAENEKIIEENWRRRGRGREEEEERREF